MSKYADAVHTDPDAIAALQAWLPKLPDQAQMLLYLDDGSQVSGTVSVRPTLQTFRDRQEREGVNGVVRLDDLLHPEQQHYVWLDRIREVAPLTPSA
ncbi:DUF3247 family protein [Xanthomonas graminis]|jgi:hypothetical protein|uniref:DUF3247 domain-containing protein n=1 Tax=Xanthomonas graminis pv. graminis TaxID=134874 RepID=A0A1M4J443_9XANT|nr:DUF3247 family protein [Xanthomonas translucens]EKU25228.1 hypothetical protein XTG29_01809 [Xanthomonas translucens pv. graminis ART-Xtg29]OAX59050.1 hypothetical protein A6R72_00390 [Xanthomonas translucens pv. graminis]UKE54844.1 DUF3247 family protein [Xanthomonas translucens pv. graminis]WIH08443.1 DUF3247 family protein [Xanthomonas translucens pv. graminis]WIH11779.1 DUF3247 family protein [Xanthomonas translucens pv. graminis]